MLRKPYPSFPLTPDKRRDAWVKKYKGKVLWIPIADPKEALAEYHRRARAIDRDAEAPKKLATSEGSLIQVFIKYTEERAVDVEAGRLSPRSAEDYRIAAKEFGEIIGRNTLVEDLSPDDFTRAYRAWEAKGLGAHAIARRVQSIRTIFRYASDQGWCDLPRFGRGFQKPQPGHRQSKPFSVEEVRLLFSVRVPDQFRAIMLLAVNCGFGNTDCSELLVKHLHLESGYHDFPRPKTSIKRNCPLWDETVKSIRKCLASPSSKARVRPESLVFLTTHGHKWVRFEESRNGIKAGRDAIGREWRNVCISAGVRPRGFYGLRHLFRTIADELETPSAVARIMGHRLEGMSDRYVDDIGHDRLRVVTEHVRARVFGARLPTMNLPLVRGASAPGALPRPRPGKPQVQTRESSPGRSRRSSPL